MSTLPVALLLVLSAIALHATPAPPSASPAPTTPVSAHLEPAVISSAAKFPLTHTPLYLCSAANCTSGCLGVVLTNVGSGNCYPTLPFTSVTLDDPSNVYAPGFVDVAPRSCTGWLHIPRKSVCYNIQGGPFT